MKFMVDVCAGRRLASWLRDQGHDTREVRDRSSNLDDEDILSWACEEDRIVVTMDKDFGTLAIALGQAHRGIVRLPDVPGAARQRLIDRVLSRHQQDLEARALIMVSRHHIRIRHT